MMAAMATVHEIEYPRAMLLSLVGDASNARATFDIGDAVITVRLEFEEWQRLRAGFERDEVYYSLTLAEGRATVAAA